MAYKYFRFLLLTLLILPIYCNENSFQGVLDGDFIPLPDEMALQDVFVISNKLVRVRFSHELDASLPLILNQVNIYAGDDPNTVLEVLSVNVDIQDNRNLLIETANQSPH